MITSGLLNAQSASKNRSFRVILCASLVLGMSAQLAQAGSFSDNSSAGQGTTASQADPSFAPFFKASKTRVYGINYSGLSKILSSVVVNFGPSERYAPGDIGEATGSRMLRGHRGKTALEGNRIVFSKFKKQHVEALTGVRRYLEEVGNEIDFGTLTKEQQLAYWINLHNVTVIEQIALHYPVALPERMRVGPQKKRLHEAKILSVKGVPLSLEEIRTKIVYPQWNEPLPMFGFFMGSAGGPNIRSSAYTGSNVMDRLHANAHEFINSMRGVMQGHRKILVSRRFAEVMPYMPGGKAGLHDYLDHYAEADVADILDTGYPIGTNRYYGRIADLSGGDLGGGASTVTVYDVPVGGGGATSAGGVLSAANRRPDTMNGLSPQATNMMIALRDKYRRLQMKGYDATVIIGEDRYVEDEPTQDDGADDNTVASPDGDQ